MAALYREKALRKLARELNFQFAVEDDYGLLDQLSEFKLFSSGYKKEIRYILRQQEDMMNYDVRIFDYRFTPYGFDHKKQRKYQTVFFIQSKTLGLPELWMKPETVTHKLASLFGFTDINFVRFPKFSGQYYLQGDDEEYIRHHFTDEVLNYFTINKGWHVEGLGFYLLFYRESTVLPTTDIAKFYRQGMKVAELLSDKDAQERIFGQ